MVIAIIAILASMLLPALSKARQTAMQIRCMNNLKSLGTKFVMYVMDYDDYIMPYWSGEGAGQIGMLGPWIYILEKSGYLNWKDEFKMAYCPSWNTEVMQTEAYQQNAWGGGANNGTYGRFYQDEGPGHYRKAEKYVRDYNWFTKGSAARFSLLADTVHIVNKKQMYWFYRVAPNDSVTMHFRHSQKANQFFLDGHAEALTFAQHRKIIYNGTGWVEGVGMMK